MDLPAPEPIRVTSLSTNMTDTSANANASMDTGVETNGGGPDINSMFQMAPPSNNNSNGDSGKKRTADSAQLKTNGDDDDDSKDLTEQQKLERRERNREHAKRSRLRKKFLLESLQEQIHGLEEQVSAFKKCIKEEVPDKAVQIITTICGDKDKFTPLPMPSGFGPVKTLMEPDFRLMSALSGSQQNFAISDPTLPDNPIVYVSQGFLDLTGYTLDQVLGRNCRFLQGPGTDQSAVEVIRKGITEGVDTSVCLLNYRADGTPFWNQFFVAALRDAENNVVNYVGVQCEVSKAVVEKHMGDKAHKAT
jgi:PAS domain S-box-containing protein